MSEELQLFLGFIGFTFAAPFIFAAIIFFAVMVTGVVMMPFMLFVMLLEYGGNWREMMDMEFGCNFRKDNAAGTDTEDEWNQSQDAIGISVYPRSIRSLEDPSKRKP